jgi:hypothetical protein
MILISRPGLSFLISRSALVNRVVDMRREFSGFGSPTGKEFQEGPAGNQCNNLQLS